MRPLLPLWLALVSMGAMPADAGDAIGSVYSRSPYRMDGTAVRGNATLFDGDTLEIGEAAAQVHLTNGAAVWLAPNARATMSGQRIRLLAGMGQFEAPPEYPLEARPIRVSASQPHTTVRVALDESGGAVVAPLNGAVQVTNSRGLRVAELVGGSAVRFANPPGADAIVSVSGCLSRSGGQFTLRDAITNAPVRLTGRGLEKEVGHMVDVSGVEDVPAGDTVNVTVTGLRGLSAGPCGAPSDANTSAGLLAMARPAGIAAQVQAAGPRLMLMVVEGEGAINNIRQRTARETIVEVQDENHRPVSGALVLFALPRSGASGTFANGATTLQVTTNARGRAVARGLRPNTIAGQFEIAVTATYSGLTAAIAIHQINSLTGAAASGSSSTATAESNAKTGGAPGGAAGGAGGGSAAGSATAIGLTIGAKVAIIGGIAAAAAAGGLAAAGAFNGGGEPAVSR